MNKNSLYGFIYFGTAFRYLQDLGPHSDVGGPGGPLANIDFVLAFLEENKMQVSLNASHALLALRNHLADKLQDEEFTLEGDLLEQLHEIIRDIRTTILAEAQEVTAFFPNEKRYNIDKLFSNISHIFGDETFTRLPINAQMDFEEAGKCIVLERPTAAAYHLMRGAECTLKHLYFSVVKKGRIKNLTWGAMVPHLEKRKALDPALKGTLDNFRRGFRNPVAHPDKFYSIEEAQDLLGTTTQLTGLIIAHPKYLKPESPR